MRGGTAGAAAPAEDDAAMCLSSFISSSLSSSSASPKSLNDEEAASTEDGRRRGIMAAGATAAAAASIAAAVVLRLEGVSGAEGGDVLRCLASLDGREEAEASEEGDKEDSTGVRTVRTLAGDREVAATTGAGRAGERGAEMREVTDAPDRERTGAEAAAAAEDDEAPCEAAAARDGGVGLAASAASSSESLDESCGREFRYLLISSFKSSSSSGCASRCASARACRAVAGGRPRFGRVSERCVTLRQTGHGIAVCLPCLLLRPFCCLALRCAATMRGSC